MKWQLFTELLTQKVSTPKHCRKLLKLTTVFVAQLAEQSLPTNHRQYFKKMFIVND